MPYAILQRELVTPDVDQLKRAFSVSPYLRDIDAQNAAHDAYGILLRGVDEENADALHAALRSEGIETELVKESALPTLSSGKATKRVEFGPSRLIAYDALNHASDVPWSEVMFIAAGYVRTGELRKHRSAIGPLPSRCDSAAASSETNRSRGSGRTCAGSSDRRSGR